MRVWFVLILILVHEVLFAAPQKPNIVLITIDTLRADYLSCNGSVKTKTPNIDRIAKEGVNFLRARSHVPLTLPAHASIMTGLYPTSHNVRDNGTFRLAKSNLTLAEIAKSNGYSTAAFVGSFVLDHRFGLNQGFDFYDDNIRSLDALESLEAERNADAVYSSFKQWLNNSSTSSPFLVWLHFYDPHFPYNPPSKFKGTMPQDLYAGEIAYTDSVIGMAMKDLESKGLLKNTIVSVVGDHGEGLGEHQEFTHSLLIYNSTLHVPMIISAPGLIPSNTKYQHLVRIIDLAPTILDYAGIPEKLGEGISLRPALQAAADAKIKSYSESQYANLNLGWAELTGIETEKYHFINAPSPELYDVVLDPGQAKNIAPQKKDVVTALRKELEAIRSKARSSQTANEMDSETREKLASLGYVSGTDHPKSLKRSNIDPKTQMQLFNQMQSGIADFSHRKYSEAVQKFESILSSHKDIYLVYDYLCSALMRLKEWDRAEKCIQAAISRNLDSSGFHVNLGLIQIERKNFTNAEKEFKTSLALQNDNVLAHYHLGNTYRSRGDNLKAVESFKNALEINPNYFYAANALGMTYASLKRDEDALKTFERAVQAEPRNVPGYFNLGTQAERMKRFQIAINAYQKFLELSNEQEYPAERKRAQAALARLQ